MASLLTMFGGAFGLARILAILGPLAYIAWVAADFKGQAITIERQKTEIARLNTKLTNLEARAERVDAKRVEHLQLLEHYKVAVSQAGCRDRVNQIIRDRQNAANSVFDQKEGQ